MVIIRKLVIVIIACFICGSCHAAPNAQTKLLLHGNGANGGYVFTDDSLNSFTVTRTNREPNDAGNTTVVTSTAQKKLGATSLLFDGTLGGLAISDDTAFVIGTNDFTIDAWCYFTAIVGKTNTIWSHNIDSTNNIQLYATTSLNFEQNVGGVGNINITEAGLFVINTWYHVAVTRKDYVYRFFVDGHLVHTESDTDVIVDGNKQLAIGQFYTHDLPSVSLQPFNGYIDEFEFVIGLAKWTSDFTPPTQEYPLALPQYIPQTIKEAE